MGGRLGWEGGEEILRESWECRNSCLLEYFSRKLGINKIILAQPKFKMNFSARKLKMINCFVLQCLGMEEIRSLWGGSGLDEH